MTFCFTMQIKFSYADLLLPHYFTTLAGHHVHIISLELKCIYQNCLKDGQNL